MPFLRVTDIVLILTLILIISYTYIIKNNSHYLNKEESAICKQIEVTQNKLAQLQIELAYLTSPSYISKIVGNGSDLTIEAIDPKNIISIDKLPARVQTGI